MRKIKLLFVIFLTVQFMTSCGTAVLIRDGECRITVTSKGKNIALSEKAAEELTLLIEKILSDEHTGITEMTLIVTMDEIKRFGKEGLSIAVEYQNTRELPISAFDNTDDSGKADIITYMCGVDEIWILMDDKKQYILSNNGGTFLLPQKYYDELMSYMK